MGSVAFEDVWYMKGYLLKVTATRRYSLLLNVKKSAARSCQEESGTSFRSIGWTAYLAFMLGTNLALIDVSSNVSIHSGPVDICLGQVSNLFKASVVAV